jgi:hypothetical protein
VSRPTRAVVLAALREISTLVVDPEAAPSFTYSNLCEAVSLARAAVAQPVEQRPCKARVAGSTPAGGSRGRPRRDFFKK